MPKATSVVGGFRSGDLVRAVVPPPRKTAGVHVGTISIRATGSCDITTNVRRVGSVSIRYCRKLQRVDGFRYARECLALPPRLKPEVSAPSDGDGGSEAAATQVERLESPGT